MSTRLVAFALMALFSQSAISASPELMERAVSAYEPYLSCVLRNAQNYSKAPDAAGDVAEAALAACDTELWQSYDATLALDVNGERLDVPTAEGYRLQTQGFARSYAIRMVVHERSKQ